MANALVRTLTCIRRPFRLWQSLAELAKVPWRKHAAKNHPIYREEADDYRPGGLYRVNLGENFEGGRYTAIRKLGYGEYSTVWLAHDLKDCRHVALKVLRSECYGGKHDIFELQMLDAISKVSKYSSHPGRNHVLQLLSRFCHTGPHGNHVCFVTDVFGPHIGFHTAYSHRRMLPIKAVKDVLLQLLLGLDFLHRECGIIHTDLKPTNILLELEEPEAVITKYLSGSAPLMMADMVSDKRHVASHFNATSKSTDVPATEIVPTPLISRLKNIKVRIIDLGVSSWVNRHLSDRIQSPFLRAPEVTIGAPWGTGVDIWSLGCLTFEFIRGYHLFMGTAAKSGAWSADDHRLALTVEWAGPFAKDFLARGKKTGEFFDLEGRLSRCQDDIKQTSFEEVLDGDHPAFQRPADLPKSEVPLLADFLRCMLVLDPEKRKSAAQMLEHEWLRETGASEDE